MAAVMPEQDDDQVGRKEQPYPSTTGQDAGEGVAEARERPVSIGRYEGGNTWDDLEGVSLRKVAEGLVRIEQRVATIEERMVTKEDLAGMATKQDLDQAIATMDDRMVTSQDLEAMATKQDLEANVARLEDRMATKEDINQSTMTILRWNISLILAGIAIMAGVTIGILQLVLANIRL